MSDVTPCFPAVLRRPRHSLLLRLVALFVSVLSYLQPAHPQETQSSTSISLHGTVINSLTREPVAHALVFSSDRFATLTDDRGHFEFQLPRIESNPASPVMAQASYGFIQLMARKPGFLDSSSSTFDQPQSADSEDATITLTPESMIVGRVNLPSSDQSDRITVAVYKRQVSDGRPHWQASGSASTRSNGEFRVANLTAGTYKVFTNELLDHDPVAFDPNGQLYGYPPFYYPAAGDFASAAAINIEAGKTVQIELSPVLQPYYPVKIAIPNVPTGTALEVSVALQGNKGPGYSLGYGGDQEIQGMLPNGIYTVEATMPQGQQSATGTVNITVKGAPMTHASLAAIPNGSIPVNIKDERSANDRQSFGIMRMGKFSRVVKADVSLQPADDFNSAGYVTLRPPRKPNDDDLALDGVRPGRYWLNVSPSGGYVASAVAGTADLLRQPLVVGPGGASPPIDIVLRDDTAAIEGTVEGMPALPSRARNPAGIGAGAAYVGPVVGMPAGPYVYCIPLPDSPGRVTSSWVSSEGTFQVQSLPPGAYRVLAFDRQQGELEYENPEAMSVYDDKGPVVRVAPGQTEHVHVTLISTRRDR